MKVLRAISYSVSAILIVVLLLVVGSRFFGVQYFGVLSGSMTPDIPVGSMVVSLPTEIQDIHEGDVVTYVADENLTVVTHRVVSVDPVEGLLTTKGDANDSVDPPVLGANVVGVVKLTVPYLGYPITYLSTTSGKIVVITVFVVALLSSLLLGKLSQKSRKKQLVITYEDPADLTDEAFAEIAEAWKKKRGEESNEKSKEQKQ